MRNYYTYGAIPDPVRTVRGFADGGLSEADEIGSYDFGAQDPAVLEQIYRALLNQQAAGPSQEYNPVTRLPTTMTSGLEASPYKPPVETAGPSQEYNPVTALPKTMPEPQGALSFYEPPQPTRLGTMTLEERGTPPPPVYVEPPQPTRLGTMSLEERGTPPPPVYVEPPQPTRLGTMTLEERGTPPPPVYVEPPQPTRLGTMTLAERGTPPPAPEYNPVTPLPKTMAAPLDAAQDPQAAAQALFNRYTSQASSPVEKKLIEQGLQGIFSYDMSRAMQGYAPNQNYDSRFQSAADSAARTANVLEQVKPYLDNGDYKTAFKIAEDASKRDYQQNLADSNNVSNTDMSSSKLVENKYAYSLLSPEILKDVTGPMTGEQIKDFYKAAPLDNIPVEEIAGTKSRYTDKGADKNVAALGGGEGYPDPLKYSVVEKGTNVLKDSLAPLAYVAGSGLLISGLGSALSSLSATGGAGTAAATAGTAGTAGTTAAGASTGVFGSSGLQALTASQLAAAPTTAQIAATIGAPSISGLGAGSSLLGGLQSAYKAVSGIPQTIGKTVAETLGLPVNTALGQTALGNSIISGGTTAAKGGDIGDIIKSGLIAAGVTYGLDKAVNAVKGIMPQATEAVNREVTNAAASTGVPASSALDALQEVVIGSKKVGDLAGLGAATGAFTSTGAKTPATVTPDQLEEIKIQSQKVPVEPATVLGAATGAVTTPPKEPATVTPDQLEEVKIQSQKVPVEPITVTGGLTGALTPTTPPPKTITPEDLEEVQVQSKKVPPSPATATGALAGALTPLEEVTVQSKRPVEEPPSQKPPVVITTPSGLEEVQVESKKVPPPPSEKPPIVIPEPTLKPPPELKDILKDYKPVEIKEPSPLENLLKDPKLLAKLLGLLGGAGAASGGGGGVGGGGRYDTSGGAGFGSGLTPFQFGRRQLNPPIDYYTYATRPEAKFFEYGQQLAEPTQPGMTPPPGQPSGVITSAMGGLIDENMTGGLIGYAHGGKPERYVDGPGSGRDDKIPAMLSDGEYVIDAETLALLGDGSTKEGARRMDQFRAKIRQHKGRALSRGRISPNAKSPEQYMGGGLS